MEWVRSASAAMTYYDELGLTPMASAEEIREAYKQLARLLHPDKLQDDESQRRLAECQMKRLNSICDTLTHPERRRAYDAFLRAPAPPPAVPAIQRNLLAAWALATLLTGAITAIVLASSGQMIQPVTTPIRSAANDGACTPAPQPRPASDATTASLRNQLRQTQRERDLLMSKLHETERRLIDQATSATQVPAPPELGASPLSVTSLRPPLPTASPPILQEPRPTHRGMAGTWYYVRSQADQLRRHQYPPEFIEAVIEDNHGAIRGRYRARYRVPDRAISPEVSFQFDGPAAHDSARLAWHGPGGAKGDLQLRLVSENTLEIGWAASELGKHLGLASGTAILIRRRDPN